MKKALSVILAVVMLMGILNVGVFAADIETPTVTASNAVNGGINVYWTAVEGATIYWVEISNDTKTQTIRFSGDVTSYNAARFVGEYTVTVKAYVAGQYFATDAVAFNAQ